MLSFRKPKRRSRHCNSVEPLESRTLLATININTAAPLQTISSIGGNYALGQYVPKVQDAVGKYTLEHLNPKEVRVPILISEWEPANDNSDPNSATAAGFKDTGKVHDMFVMLKDMQAQGRTIHGAVFNAPNWMVTSATITRYNGRVLSSNMYDEMAESMAQYVKYAKDTYGINFATVSINESDGGFRVLLTPTQYADLVKKVGARFAAMGLATKWVIGDSYYTKGADDFARNILAVSGVKQYAAAISFHSWWSESLGDSEWKKLADLGKQYGLPVWANETGFWALQNKDDPEFKSTWSAAIRLSKIHNKVLRLTNASQLLYWQYQKDFQLLDIDSTTGAVTLYPTYYVVKELVDNLQPGSQVLSTSSDDIKILPLAAKDTARNHFMAQAINQDASVARTVTFKGLPNQALTLIRDSATERSKNLGTFMPVNGELTFTLPKISIVTLVGKLTSGPASPPPPPPATPAGTLPSGWAQQDVGDIGTAGSSTYSNSKFTVNGAGYDIGGLADTFQYAYTTLSGDGEIVARLTGIENTAISAKASLMLRDKLATRAKEVSLSQTPGNGLWLQTRKTARGSSGAVSMGKATAPIWLKIHRSGDMFTYFSSPDGASWTQIAKSTVNMRDTIYVGLAVTSRDTSVINTSYFDHVSVTTGAQSQAVAASFGDSAPLSIAPPQNFIGPQPSLVKSIFNSGERIEDDAQG